MKREVLIALGLALLALVVFWPAARYDSVDFDDADYVFKNPFVQQGLTAQSVTWAFTTIHRNYWLPLTWISYMLDTDLQGPAPAGYHRTSVLLHAVNAALLFLVLSRMTGKAWASAMVAALFAVHPLRLETVAWISDRKDLLSGLFWLLGIGAYARYAGRPGVGRYALVLLCMVLGMMAKQMMVTFPFLLLLLDYWPLGRARGQRSEVRDQKENGGGRWLRLIVEKVPLLAVSILFSLATIFLHPRAGLATGLGVSSLVGRALQAGLNYVAYVGKTFWPVRLCVVYPMASRVHVAPAILAALVLLAATAAAIRYGRQHPYLPVGWFWFLGTLVPVIGFVRVGNADIADRFTYVPSIGLFILLAWGVPELAARWRDRKAVLGALSAVVLLGLVGATRAQLPYWKNTETLSRRALAVTKDNFVAWNSFGRAMEQQGRLSDALACYAESARIAPTFGQARLNLGLVLARMGRFDDAIRQLEAGLRVDPGDASLHSNLGSVLFSAGERSEGFAHLREGVRLNPHLPDAHFNLGWGLFQAGKKAEALPEFAEAARINPKDDLAHFYAGVLYAEGREFGRAAVHLETAVKLVPARKSYRLALDEVRRRTK